jgi:non-ribosomal peptide synthetase component E (peptide arylation enzyme)
MSVMAVLIPAISPMEELELPAQVTPTIFEAVGALLAKGLDSNASSIASRTIDGAIPSDNIELMPCKGMNIAAGVFFVTFHAFTLKGFSDSDQKNERASRLCGFEVKGPTVIVRMEGDAVETVRVREIVAILSITG